jgi:hypothetical protein
MTEDAGPLAEVLWPGHLGPVISSGNQAPQLSCGKMAEHCPRAGGEHGGHPTALTGETTVTDGIDAAVD